MKQFLIIFSLLFSFGTANAHEGHSKTPKSLSPPHGGIVKGTDNVNLEMVVEPGGVKLYPLDNDSKAIPTGKVKLEGKMSVPRKTKSEKVKFDANGDHFVAKVDAKGAHRYDLEVSVNFSGKLEKVTFSVEPQ